MRIQDPSSRWLVGIALAILVLIALSLIVAIAGRQGKADLLPEDTPEGSVQRYLLAIDEGDFQTAYSYLSSKLQGACTYQHLRDSASWLTEDDLSVTLEKTETINEQTVVDVRITRFSPSPSPFGPSQDSFLAFYTLELDEGVWRLTEPPWPMGWCPGLERSSDLPAPVKAEPY